MPGYRILVADDEPCQRELLAGFLRQALAGGKIAQSVFDKVTHDNAARLLGLAPATRGEGQWQPGAPGGSGR